MGEDSVKKFILTLINYIKPVWAILVGGFVKNIKTTFRKGKLNEFNSKIIIRNRLYQNFLLYQ